MNRLLTAAVSLAALVALADDVTPEQAAKVDRETKKANAEVAKKYGNKKSSELTSDERRAMIADQNAANAKVLEKNGVNAKDYARFEATASAGQRSAAKESGAALDRKEAADSKAAEAKKAAPAGAASGTIEVEKGLPAQDEASGFEGARPSKGKRGR